MKFALKMILLLFVFLVSGCSHLQVSDKVDEQIEHIDHLISGFSATRYSNIYFSGQPPLDSFDKLKALGFQNIVNLRTSNEGNYDEKTEAQRVKEAGLNYTHIPVRGSAPLTDQKIEEITQAIVKNRSLGKTLVHCSSGNRVALWAGGQFYKDHGVSKEDAQKIARQIGLTKVSLQENLKNFLEDQP